MESWTDMQYCVWSVTVPPVSYPLYVYVLCGWGHVYRVDLWLLRRSSLGSRSTPSPPYSVSGIPQTHTHQHHHCQHVTAYSSHPSTDSNTPKNQSSSPIRLLRFLCSFFFFFKTLFFFLFLGCLSPLTAVYYSQSAVLIPKHTEQMHKQTGSRRQTMWGRGWPIQLNINLVYWQRWGHTAVLQCVHLNYRGQSHWILTLKSL